MENIIIQNSVQQAEKEAFEKITPHISKHLDYTTQVYDILCQVNLLLVGKKLKEIPYTHFVHQILIARIADYLRPVILLTQQGYVDQAATLAASMFELAHTLLYIGCDIDRARLWGKANEIEDEMPRKVFGKNWLEIISCNKEIYDETFINDDEYNVYKQLCWMKHSLPCLQGMSYDKDEEAVWVSFAPRWDNNAVRIASFALQHSGRYGQLAVGSLFINHAITNELIEKKQFEASTLRLQLHNEGITKYGNSSPFKETK
ncbi:MAG: hypothetical protein M1561_04450 [Gammaproteobacteria bacterium]|nr:hypothetical protein [Gammaproteobacteria bacterium]